MNINIRTNAIALTPAISSYVNKRLIKIGNLLKDDSSAHCDIEIGRTTGHHQKGNIFRAEIHIVGSSKNAYASSEQNDLYTAIDLVRDEIMRELKVDKSKRISLIRRSGARLKNMVKGLWPWKRHS